MALPTASHDRRRDPVVAFQGERGAYADAAIDGAFGDRVRRLPCWDFDGVVAAVASGRARYGVMPVHNSIIGEIPGVALALSRASLVVQRHVVVPVAHCLLGVPGSTIGGLRTVFSHPAALSQCRGFLGTHRWLEAVASYDTAGAAREVAARRRLWEGAIAAEGCASRYGLDVLQHGVGDRADNCTRFAVLSPVEDIEECARCA